MTGTAGQREPAYGWKWAATRRGDCNPNLPSLIHLIPASVPLNGQYTSARCGGTVMALAPLGGRYCPGCLRLLDT